MRHQSLHTLLRIREYALEKEEQKLGERNQEETLKLNECAHSKGDLELSYQHTVGEAKASDYLRRDKCVREAGNRHLVDLRQLALVQKARHLQIEMTLLAKQKTEMIERVIQKRQTADLQEEDSLERRRMDDVSQNLFIYHRDHPI